jgi:hypothetical protein
MNSTSEAGANAKQSPASSKYSFAEHVHVAVFTTHYCTLRVTSSEAIIAANSLVSTASRFIHPSKGSVKG